MNVPCSQIIWPRLSRAAAIAAVTSALCILGLASADGAGASRGIRTFDTAINGPTEGEATQASSHPFEVVVSFSLNSAEPASAGQVLIDGNLRDTVVDLPPGLIGDLTAVPQCPRVVAEAGSCSPATQVGTLTGNFARLTPPNPLDPYDPARRVTTGLYNVVPRKGDVSDFGFTLTGVTTHIVSRLDASKGYAVRSTSTYISQGFDTVGTTTVRLWGVPADPRHDVHRGSYYFCNGDAVSALCNNPATAANYGGGSPAGIEARPLLTVPSLCSAPLKSALSVDFWQATGVWSEAQNATHSGMTGCDSLTFDPSIAIEPDTARADTPTGIGFDLTVPQVEATAGLATPTTRRVSVTFPKGMVVNPSSADGLGSCSEAQIGLGKDDPGTCPDDSKLGTVEITTPVLDHPLKGSVYLATPRANPFGSLLALYIEVVDPTTGIDIKLPGAIKADPTTGQLTSTFDETPQLPFSNLHLQLKSGPRAALRTPASCGTYTTVSSLTPWSAPQSGPPATPTSSFTVGQGSNGAGCPSGGLPNDPTLEAGTANPLAGSYSPFVFRLSRPDGSQELSALEATLPKGLLGRLEGTSYCPDSALTRAAGRSGAAEQASPSCPSGSRVGSVSVTAGAGPRPIDVAGAAYLAGPYKGAPLSLAIVTPALAGPFDLGTVVVRNALYIDPVTAQISVKSDPIPTILEGIPLDIRSVEVLIDKSDFTLNPTNCDPKSLTAGVVGTNSLVSLSNPFQVANCEALAFKPKLALRLYDAPTRRGGVPALQATLTTGKGEANIAKTSVVLPGTELLEQAHIRTVCTRVQFAADSCPKGSIYGSARAFTPLLDKPLEGPVYLRSNGGERELPDLVADLKGQIDVQLVGYIDSVKRHGVPRVRTRFVNVPDAPVTKFVLNMKGGSRGLLVNNTNLCKAKPRAEVSLAGQNAKDSTTNPLVQVGGCGKKAKKGKKRG
jgi:hypothetical protein